MYEAGVAAGPALAPASDDTRAHAEVALATLAFLVGAGVCSGLMRMATRIHNRSWLEVRVRHTPQMPHAPTSDWRP